MDRIIQSEMQDFDIKWENKLRPQTFEEFPGQVDVKEKMKVFVKAATQRSEPLDHTLLFGPPGLGKTTLAQIIAHEMKVEIKVTSAPAIDKKGDLAAILTSLKPFSILFIDSGWNIFLRFIIIKFFLFYIGFYYFFCCLHCP